MRILVFQRHATYRFIADFAEDFRTAGHTVEWLPPTEGPRIPAHLLRFAPDRVFCVGASPALAKAAGGRVPIIYYELDKILNLSLWDGAPAGERDVVFTTYRDDIATFRGFGFRHVHYLPFCPNIARRAADPASTPDLPPPPEHGVAFVGSLVREQTNDYRHLLDHAHRSLAGRAEAQRQFDTLSRRLSSVLEDQDRAYAPPEYRIPKLLDGPQPAGVGEAMARFSLPPATLANILAKEAAYRQRTFWLSALAEVDLWGPEGPAEPRPGLHYHGPLDQYSACGDVFARAAANLNIQRIYARDGLSDRVFNVLAAGGCLLADSNPALLELFEPGRDLEVFETPEELREKATRLQRDLAYRARLVRNGHAILHERHLFQHRLQQMLSLLP